MKLIVALLGITVALAATSSASEQASRRGQYLALAEATLRNPVTPSDLAAALQSAESTAALEALFLRTIVTGVVLEERVVTAELGGEATLDRGSVQFLEYPDPVHLVVREAFERRGDPAGLLDFLESAPEGTRVLKETGGLHALLFQMKDGFTEQQRELLDSVLAGALDIHLKTWSVDPETQAAGIEAHEWRGRYVGFWHIHPPRTRGGQLTEGIEPSVPDMQNAVELGQFLTVVFQPDGFDAYDLSALRLSGRADLSRARVVRVRPPGWRERFDVALRAKLSRSD